MTESQPRSPQPRSSQPAPSVLAQPVVTPLTSAAIVLVLTVDRGGEAAVRSLLADLSGLERSVGSRLPEGGLACVAGLGSEVWDRLFDGPRPAELHPFRELRGERHHAPATPGDLVLHLRAPRTDACFELASQILTRLSGAVTVVDETHGFRYFDTRDLLGFVQGTENPTGRDALGSVLVGAEDPAFAGGSYLVVQKYRHDLTAWKALPVEEQERVVGRSKADNIELPDGVKPADSHVALTSLTGPDGTARRILRETVPFGSFGRGEFGTYFIGYANSPAVTEQMLENMFVGRPAGRHDRLLDYSTAVTGTLCFVPSADFLDHLPDPPTAAAARPRPAAQPAPGAQPRPAAQPHPAAQPRGGAQPKPTPKPAPKPAPGPAPRPGPRPGPTPASMPRRAADHRR